MRTEKAEVEREDRTKDAREDAREDARSDAWTDAGADAGTGFGTGARDAFRSAARTACGAVECFDCGVVLRDDGGADCGSARGGQLGPGRVQARFSRCRRGARRSSGRLPVRAQRVVGIVKTEPVPLPGPVFMCLFG